ncbi:hypothetical protein BJV77DRAFT_997819 [Russula vinacea]|nr:hypothetical protein BJV77DRAFT_997819 [Russula vinacea]
MRRRVLAYLGTIVSARSATSTPSLLFPHPTAVDLPTLVGLPSRISKRLNKGLPRQQNLRRIWMHYVKVRE